MAQSVRAILLASAIAASFFGLRASRLGEVSVNAQQLAELQPPANKAEDRRRTVGQRVMMDGVLHLICARQKTASLANLGEIPGSVSGKFNPEIGTGCALDGSLS